MGRNQDRAFMQQLNKDKDWYRKLPTDKKRFIGWYIEQKVIENDNITAKILDKCFQSAISDNTDLELLDLKKIIAEANEYMQEYQEFLIKEKEGFNMIENKEVTEKVKEKIKSYINGKMDKAKGLKLLKSEFNLPNAELSDLWLQVKSELGINTKNKHTPAKKMATLDIKLEEPKEKKCKETVADKEIPENTTGELKANLINEGEHGFEIGNPKEPISIRKEDLEALKELVKEKPKESTFKIKSIVLECKNGNTYTKDDRGVIDSDNTLYKNIDEVIVEKKNFNSNIEEEEKALIKKIEELRKYREEENRKYAEIEEIFNM